MAKSSSRVVICATCDKAVTGGEPFSGPDDRSYCAECGRMMQRMERMFVPEGAIIKERQVSTAVDLRESSGGYPKARPLPATPAVEPGAPHSPGPAPAPPPARPVEKRLEHAILPSAAQRAKAPVPPTGGGGGKVVAVLALLLLGAGGAWYFGVLPGSGTGADGDTAIDVPVRPRDEGKPPTKTTPAAKGTGKTAGAIAATDQVALAAAVGNEVTVQGNVTDAVDDGQFFRIRFGEGADAFEGVIPAHRRRQFRLSLGKDIAGAVRGKSVRLTGKLAREDDRCLITLDQPRQLIVEGD